MFCLITLPNAEKTWGDVPSEEFKKEMPEIPKLLNIPRNSQETKEYVSENK